MFEHIRLDKNKYKYDCIVFGLLTARMGDFFQIQIPGQLCGTDSSKLTHRVGCNADWFVPGGENVFEGSSQGNMSE